jgi:hypothetical protein
LFKEIKAGEENMLGLNILHKNALSSLENAKVAANLLEVKHSEQQLRATLKEYESLIECIMSVR